MSLNYRASISPLLEKKRKEKRAKSVSGDGSTNQPDDLMRRFVWMPLIMSMFICVLWKLLQD